MRVERAIDRYLAWRRMERDATPRSLESYYRVLSKMATWLEARLGDDVRVTDIEGRQGTELLRECIAAHVGNRSAATRSNWISTFHSFWQWCESEDLIEADPSRKIRRPPKRKPDVYRPPATDLLLGRAATTMHERGAWLLMEGVGLRAASVCGVRWEHVDLTHGRIRVFTKGAHWRRLPIAPDVLDELRNVYRALEPRPTDYVFTVEEERWVDQEHRIRTRRDPAKPSTEKALWSMVQRVCRRAGIRPMGPHALRHGFATRLLHQGIDRGALQQLMGHADPRTTQGYTDELVLEELDEALLQASSMQKTSSGEPAIALVEAAGIEPASAPAREDSASDTESDPPLDPEKGRHK